MVQFWTSVTWLDKKPFVPLKSMQVWLASPSTPVWAWVTIRDEKRLGDSLSLFQAAACEPLSMATNVTSLSTGWDTTLPIKSLKSDSSEHRASSIPAAHAPTSMASAAWPGARPSMASTPRTLWAALAWATGTIAAPSAPWLLLLDFCKSLFKIQAWLVVYSLFPPLHVTLFPSFHYAEKSAGANSHDQDFFQNFLMYVGMRSCCTYNLLAKWVKRGKMYFLHSHTHC